MDWIEEELCRSDYGDKRLNERGKRVIQELSSSPPDSIPRCMKGFSELQATYRFFQNDKVTLESVLAPHQAATLERIKYEAEILVVQDTTELDYSAKQEKIKGLGRLNHEARQGLFLHPALAITRERLCLGVVGAQIYSRDEEHSSAAKRKKRGIETKESQRWLNGYEQGCAIAEQAPETTVIVVGDRESDIYELYLEAEHGEAEWIVRAKHDRRLVGNEDNAKYLFETLAKAKPLGEVVCVLPSTNGKEGRKAELTLIVQKFTPRGPYSNNRKLPEVTVTAVLAEERNPPKGSEPIKWFLLTSLPVKNVQQASAILDRYLCRWQIEIFFRTLKSGCAIEELQLEHIDRLRPCIAMYMIITWRIMFCMMLGRQCPSISCAAVFEDFEWKAAYAVAKKKKPPSIPPPLGEMITIIAGFGGYLARKNDPPPGPKAMWIGMQALFGYAVGFQTATEIYGIQ